MFPHADRCWRPSILTCWLGMAMSCVMGSPAKEIHPWGHCSGIEKWLKLRWFGGSIAAAHRSAHQLPRDRGCCLWLWRIKQLNWKKSWTHPCCGQTWCFTWFWYNFVTYTLVGIISHATMYIYIYIYTPFVRLLSTCIHIPYLVGGLDHFLFFHMECHHPNWLSIFSDGLKPPTRYHITTLE